MPVPYMKITVGNGLKPSPTKNNSCEAHVCRDRTVSCPYLNIRAKQNFFAKIMLKFNKDFNAKIISLVIAVLFVFNSAAYGIDLPRNTPPIS
ncbi:MAG: hypothetical protein AUJ70_00705 [Candidatus Omnitrophica bacterium CG1_02_40_15]|nr:MAG: hypothetical protein AUJ70_00705 [Candidatus Omnitrophica bacterium CG1_02_40_15]